MNLAERKSTKTLVCLLQSMVGKRVSVELRNLTVIRGTLASCDSFMNVELVDAKVGRLRDPKPKTEAMRCDNFHISSRHIRLIHFENHFDVIGTLETAVRKSRRKERPNLPHSVKS